MTGIKRSSNAASQSQGCNKLKGFYRKVLTIQIWAVLSENIVQDYVQRSYNHFPIVILVYLYQWQLKINVIVTSHVLIIIRPRTRGKRMLCKSINI